MSEIIGIGHSLMDVYIEIDDDFLQAYRLTKGGMHLVDDKTFEHIFTSLKEKHSKIAAGGSVPNTMHGLAQLGCTVAEFGSVGNDEYGNYILNEKKEIGIQAFFNRHHLPTGTVISFISPDGQRTFVVYLGAAQHLDKTSIKEEVIKNAKIIHFTGYEFESPTVRPAIDEAVKIAKQNNVLVSFDLADPGVIQRNFTNLVPFLKDHVDIIFMNEEEAEEFTGKPAEIAHEVMAKHHVLTVVKLGAKGSIIADKNMVNVYKIPAEEITAKDTTGAGDMFAAGILYGLINDIPYNLAGKIASYAAARVVEKVGARLETLDISHLK